MIVTAGSRKRQGSPPERPPRGIRAVGSSTAWIVLAVALIVSVVGSVYTYVNVSAAFARQTAVDHARQRLSALFELQLEEETALRGYLETGQKVFIQPYESEKPQFDPIFNELEGYVRSAGISDAIVPLYDLRHQHRVWHAQVADPLIAQPNAADALERMQQGKLFIDQMRADFRQLLSVFDAQAAGAVEESQSLLARAAIVTALLILLFGLAAVVADVFRGRTQAALARERVVTDTLQRTFLSGWDLLPHLRVGTAYLSSTREAAVGGDLFDVHRIDDHRSMLLVADVSGKGLSAAVDTALVKYSIRVLVESETDPGDVLTRFNRIYINASSDPSAFVSVFLGVLDDRDLSLRYASAGHAPVYLRRGRDVAPVHVTGPLIGLARTDTYSSSRVQLAVDDTLVLATDGLTEARDAAGMTLDEERAMRWIANGSQDPQRLADEIVERLTRYAGGRIADDLALLIIKVLRPPSDLAPITPDTVERRDVDPAPADVSAGAP